LAGNPSDLLSLSQPADDRNHINIFFET